MRHRSSDQVHSFLRALGIEIDWFTSHNAEIAAEMGIMGGNFRKNARDYFIASHANMPPRLLITNNTKDFEILGDRVLEPHEVQKRRYL